MPEKTLYFPNPRLLHDLYCGRKENLAEVENTLAVNLVTREDWLQVEGEEKAIEKVEALFQNLQEGRGQGMVVNNTDFRNLLRAVANGHDKQLRGLYEKPLLIQVKNRGIVPRSVNQKKYLRAIAKTDIVFGIGPAGTGKTYLAMAAAIDALLKEEVDKLILTRPAVEAGEALGFLPGDLIEKIEPYLRPLYDAMYDILGRERSVKLIEREIIEIAPLAYMRGRTLSNAFIILDEAQNTTPEQMMMFLTRMGDSSRMVITGDITQVDLPSRIHSGLKQAIHVLRGVEDISFVYLEGQDVVRHPVVQNIIEAYDRFTKEKSGHVETENIKGNSAINGDG